MNILRHRRSWLGIATGALLLGAAGCDDLLEVTNAGPVPDERLENAQSIPGLVTGMSADLSNAMDVAVQEIAVMTDELFHGGSYTAEGLFNRGVIRSEDVNTLWEEMHLARFVAEDGIRRLRRIATAEPKNFSFDNSAFTARAYLYAGFANRLLGENVCDAVIDGGPKLPRAAHFARADSQFTEAIRISRALNNTTLVNAALGGRASVRLGLGRYAEAAEDARLVPTPFVFNAIFSTGSSRENNDLVFETNNRREYTVFNTMWARNPKADPRVPWDTVRTGSRIQTGQDGRTPFFRQLKYRTLDADIPLTKGTEMLLIRAEAALRSGDVPGAVSLINQERAAFGLPAAAAANRDAAWRLLQKERGAVLWVEGRRFNDLRRWHAEGLRFFQQEPGDPRLATWAQRDQCIPVSREEVDSNPNF